MTDIVPTVPISIHGTCLPRPSLPRIAIGSALDAFAMHFAHAFSLAYVALYASLQRRPPVIPDDDLEGRDPNW